MLTEISLMQLGLRINKSLSSCRRHTLERIDVARQLIAKIPQRNALQAYRNLADVLGYRRSSQRQLLKRLKPPLLKARLLASSASKGMTSSVRCAHAEVIFQRSSIG